MGSDIRIPPTGQFIVGTVNGQILQWNNTTKKWDLAAAPSGGVTPLSDVVWIDGGTTVPLVDQDGSIGAPYATIQQALDGMSGTQLCALICPGDYTAEVLSFGTNIKVQLQGVARPGAGAGFNGANAMIGSLTTISGGEQGSLTLVNLECTQNLELAGSVVCVDCINVFIVPSGLDFCSFEIFGGLLQGLDAAGGTIDGVIFGPAPGSLQLDSNVTVTNSNLIGSALTVTFTAAPGVVSHDLATEGTGPVPAFTITNGTAVRLALPVQSITGATEQEQIDSIVLGLVALGLATDNR